MAAPASAMASEQFAAVRKLPAEAGPPFTAAAQSVSPPPPPPRPPRPPCAGSGMPLAVRYSRIFFAGTSSLLRITPLSPTNNVPAAGIDFPSSASSSGADGRLPPSDQYSLIRRPAPQIRRAAGG